MKQDFTKEQALIWLRDRKEFLSISAIAKASKITNLPGIVSEKIGAGGKPLNLADKHLPNLLSVINKIRL